MKQSQMHPDRVAKVAVFPLPQPGQSQYSWQSAPVHQPPVGDMQYVSGTLAHLCREVASPGCIFAGGQIDKLQEPLVAEEHGEIENAVLKRQREFVAGRTSARMALLQMGHVRQPVPRSASRAPLWPGGVVGSISHNSRYCVAVTSSSSLYKGIGIDIESPAGLSPDLVHLVCTPKEREFLSHCSDPTRSKLAKLFFSAKESVYKCIFPIFKEQLEFEDIEIVFDLEARTFQANLEAGTHGMVKTINGRFASSEHLLITLAVLPSPLPQPQPQLLPLPSSPSASRPESAPCREHIR